MKFFVIGGAGYIGSHFVAESISMGHQCLVYDNLSTGHQASIPKTATFIKGDILDQALLERTLNDFKPDTIYHFAALALVGESVEQPDKYYNNNVTGVETLLGAMKATKTLKPLVFSSSCAVFGNPYRLPISEDDRKAPISPYGRSKLMAEFMIEDYALAFGFKAVAFRYFNACGAHAAGAIGEDHSPESHLIPNLLIAAIQNKKFMLFGKDFNTKDGTCVRDYIHVTDLAISHIRAADYLAKAETPTFTAIHLGTGHGYSNLEILKTVEKVINRKIEFEFADRRPGDAEALYANNEKAKALLNFEPKNSQLENIIRTAWGWHKAHPDGYRS